MGMCLTEMMSAKTAWAPLSLVEMGRQSGCVLLWAIKIDAGHADSRVRGLKRDRQVKLNEVKEKKKHIK